MSSSLRSTFSDLLDAAVSSLWDPEPIAFPPGERGIRPVRAACGTAHVSPMLVRRLLNRNDFLRGCLVFTEDEAIEHLVVGFGREYGTTVRVEAIAHLLGSADHVDIPPELWNAIHEWLARTSRGRVLLVHNHPPNLLNRFFDNLPLASGTDRDTWLAALLRSGGVRFYLVENGYVRELRTPRVLGLVKRLLQQAPGEGR